MKTLKVIVKDKNTLILDEDGLKGDEIDLTSVAKIDFTSIDTAIMQGTDNVYMKKLEEAKRVIENQYVLETKNKDIENNGRIKEFQLQLEQLKKDNENALKNKEQEVMLSYTDKVDELKKQLENFQVQKELDLQKLKIQNDDEKRNELNEKDKKISELSKQNEFLQKSKETEIENVRLKTNSENDKTIQELKDKLHESEEKYSALQRQKGALNIKQTGEDLEAWCNKEAESYMQNGLDNCTWEKDNVVVRNDSEDKGSKADYIFKVYADQETIGQEKSLLASVCMDMKDENPDSTNKKTNAFYYKKLDENRTKKNCRYAVLVSNLEMDKPNDIPIMKVREFKDMYVVRPAYMMTFLNMIVSLTKRFSELILKGIKEEINLQKQEELLNQFDYLKTTYLDKPLLSLQDSVKSIQDKSESITKAAISIKETCDKIEKSYIDSITDKLSKFEIKLSTSYRKFEK
ncbi:MAG: DUF2130 domain-containing protein [Bacilli bacterium]